ncbi:4Fe-4S binding protein [Parasalinivibrio latis]|uniref:4Fe-4S binding protein n=1 Tax=Parasalinivibrio latis TaxID=2952610 RepID=UPI0030DF7114
MSTNIMNTTINNTLEQCTTPNGQARLQALQGTVELGNLIPPTVSYESRGDLLVIGPFEQTKSIAEAIHNLNSITLLVTDGEKGDSLLPIYHANDITVSGFMGAFEVRVKRGLVGENLALATIGRETFDLILDVTVEGVHEAAVPPPGYFALGRGLCTEEEVLETLPEMKGIFDKPKYFRLDTDICAHSSRGVEGCTRCLEACPAEALSVVDQKVTINPYLCQGVGTCATSCPTGAISYALPDADNTQHFVYSLLNNYQKAGGKEPVILFYAPRFEDLVARQLQNQPGNIIPVQLEELGSVGIETWFSALVYGAHQVVLAGIEHIPEKIVRVLEGELAVAHTFLNELGFDSDRIAFVDIAQPLSGSRFDSPLFSHTDKLDGDKREKLASSLDLLWQASAVKPSVSELPDGSPYGFIHVDESGCTSCMGCVAVCPTSAIQDIGDSPGFTFSEQSCVQCGLCEQSCPENVITLEPRYNWDAESRRARNVVVEEKAAHCISCGKPFAPASMVNMLIEKLQSHSHYQDDAIRRLSMCEDCRVRDIFTDLAENPGKQINL